VLSTGATWAPTAEEDVRLSYTDLILHLITDAADAAAIVAEAEDDIIF